MAGFLTDLTRRVSQPATAVIAGAAIALPLLATPAAARGPEAIADVAEQVKSEYGDRLRIITKREDARRNRREHHQREGSRLRQQMIETERRVKRKIEQRDAESG